jgi:hypothetical protein
MNSREHFLEEQKRLRAEGRFVGFGLATFIEPAPGGAEYMAAMGGGKEPAIVNAISDALGVKITEQPLPPTRILELMGAIPVEK